MDTRKINKVHYTPDFAKEYRKLSKNVQRAVDKQDAIFRKNPFYPSLKTHKLKGPLKNQWSFYVNKQYRILFEFLDKNTVVFYDLGTHSIYQ